MRTTTQYDFDLILDCFMGYDSGVSFARFMMFMNELDELAYSGDEKAAELILIMRRFAQMIRVGIGKDKLRE